MSIQDKINELKKKNKGPAKTEIIIPVPKSEWEIDAVKAEVVDDSKFFPREYDAELGITEHQFQYLCRRAKALFGSEENLDEAYRNIPNQLLEKTGKTKAQVLLAYSDYIADCDHFRTKYERRKSDGLWEVDKITEDDTKNINAFHAMFQGKEVSQNDMKTIEGIVSTYVPGYVSGKVRLIEALAIQESRLGRFFSYKEKTWKDFQFNKEELESKLLLVRPDEAKSDDKWIGQGRVSKGEYEMPSTSEEVKIEPIPPFIPPHGNDR